MKKFRRHLAAPFLGAAIAALMLPALGAADAGDAETAPLSGIVRAAGRPVAGAALLIRGVVDGAKEVFVRTLRTDKDGSFVLPDLRAGVYTVVSLHTGFRPAIVRVLHKTGNSAVSFVPMDLEKADSVLPASPLGAADPWAARAMARGDVLREADAVIADADETPGAPASVPPPTTSAPAANASRTAVAIPVRASVSSMAGFESEGSSTVSKTSLDVSGTMGDRLRWGLEGKYSRSVSSDGLRVGDSSQIALAVAPSPGQAFQVTTRRKVLPGTEDLEDSSRYAAHTVDWSGATGAASQASVSARLVSQSNLVRTGPAAELFTPASRAFDVTAGYRTELQEGNSLRVTVGYRSFSGPDVDPIVDRETRVGGGASVRIFHVIVVEGGATGDFSARSRGVTPEVRVAVETGDGWRAYGFASRRFERRFDDTLPPGFVGSDLEDLTRISHTSYRGGVVYAGADGTSFSVEGSRRELGGTYRFLLESEFTDQLDSLYFVSGDVATELSSSATFSVGKGLQGRLSARGGTIRGEREAATIESDEASYGMVDAAVRVAATRTTVGIGYRSVSQVLARRDVEMRNDLSAVELSLAQTLPIPLLRSVGSEWRALLSLELGRRRLGATPESSNRQLAGGLSLAF